MKWIIALVLCFVFPWVGIPWLIWLVLPILSDMWMIQQIAASEMARSAREQRELDQRFRRS